MKDMKKGLHNAMIQSDLYNCGNNTNKMVFGNEHIGNNKIKDNDIRKI
jgi:hypothetical protein